MKPHWEFISKLPVEETLLVVDNPFQVLHVDVSIDDQHGIVGAIGVVNDNLANLLSITAYQHRLLAIVAL